MQERRAFLLAGRGLVEVAGPDAASFLQGLVTNDVSRARDGQAVYAALLTPQGKIVHDFMIMPFGDGFLLDCVGRHAADLVSRLGKYRLRAKVSLADRSNDFAVAAVLDADRSPGAALAAVRDPRLDALGWRLVLRKREAEQALRDAGYALAADPDYHRHRLALGVPDSELDIPPETYFPLDCNFEELNGVDFDKGCYVGQELTARMKHRATARRRLLPVGAAGPLPAPGTVLKRGSSDIGELRGGVGDRGMALVRLDRLGNAREATADGVAISIGRPSYNLILPEGAERQ